MPREGGTFNQFLIVDDQPLLFHTGPRMLFRETLAGVTRLIDPTRLRWVSWSHFEADESGALNEFLELAAMAQPVHTELGAGLNINDFAGAAFTGDARQALRDYRAGLSQLAEEAGDTLPPVKGAAAH